MAIEEPQTLTEDPDIRTKIERAFFDVLERTVRRIEAVTYSRVGSQSRLVSAKPLISSFTHTSSRAGDPQFHVHLVVHNVGVRPDGSTGALLTRPYFVRKMMWGALAACDASCALSREWPGIEFCTTKTGVEVAGVPQELLRHFSSRRREIEAKVGDPETASAVAKAMACLKTRDPKQLVTPLATLFARWRQEAQRFAFGHAEISHLLRPRTPTPVDKSKVLDQAFRSAVVELSQRQSHFGLFDLVRYSAHAAVGNGVTGHDVMEYVSREITRSPKVEYIGKARGPRYSTPEILAKEKRLLSRAAKMAAGVSHRITFAKLGARLSLESARATRRWLILNTDRSLTPDQRAAIRFVAQKTGHLAILSTPTGTAKLETLARLAEFYRAAGYKTFGAAPNARATDRLEKEARLPAIPLKTLLDFADSDRSLVAATKHAGKQLVRQAVGRRIGLFPFKRRPLLTPDAVVIVDAAQRISTQEMDRLLTHVSRAGAKLVLVGNPNGLEMINKGGIPFASLTRRLPGAELTEIVHPRSRSDAQNLRRIERGEIKALIEDLTRRGRFHVFNSRESAIQRLLSDWEKAGGPDNPKENSIVVPSPEVAKLVNHRASEIVRNRHQEVSGTNKPKSLILASGEKVFVGDRVLCLRSSRRFGVQAGSAGTLLAVSRRLNSMQVEVDEGQRVTLPLRVYPHITRGYAQTVAFAAPTDHARLLLGGGYEDRRTALSKFALAAETTHVYTDREHAGPELEELSRELSSDRTKTLATDIKSPVSCPQQKR